MRKTWDSAGGRTSGWFRRVWQHRLPSPRIRSSQTPTLLMMNYAPKSTQHQLPWPPNTNTVPMTTKQMRGIDSRTQIPKSKDIGVQLYIPLNYLGGHRFGVGVRLSYLWIQLQHSQTTWRGSWKAESDSEGCCLWMADTGRMALLYMGSGESQGSNKE